MSPFIWNIPTPTMILPYIDIPEGVQLLNGEQSLKF